MKSKTTGINMYISLDGKVVTVIETIGEYDNILRREFNTDEEAVEYYIAQGGRLQNDASNVMISAGGTGMVDKEKQYKRQDAWDKANIDRITVKAPKGTKEEWQKKADEAGLSLTQWIIKKCQGD